MLHASQGQQQQERQQRQSQRRLMERGEQYYINVCPAGGRAKSAGNGITKVHAWQPPFLEFRASGLQAPVALNFEWGRIRCSTELVLISIHIKTYME